MRKILGGASALALVFGLSSASVAEDLTSPIGSVTDADAISLNVQEQNTLQTIGSLDENLDGQYDAQMGFGDLTFKEQRIDSNNFNTGQNGAQQNGVGLAVAVGGTGHIGVNGLGELDLAYTGDSVAANVLAQNSVQLILGVDENINDTASYSAGMHFGAETFNHQIGVANNFNTGQNATQQGGVAISVSVPSSVAGCGCL